MKPNTHFIFAPFVLFSTRFEMVPFSLWINIEENGWESNSRFVFISSISIYGWLRDLRVTCGAHSGAFSSCSSCCDFYCRFLYSRFLKSRETRIELEDDSEKKVAEMVRSVATNLFVVRGERDVHVKGMLHYLYASSKQKTQKSCSKPKEFHSWTSLICLLKKFPRVFWNTHI